MDTQSLVNDGNKFKSTQLFIVAGTVLMTMVVSILCIGLTVQYEVKTDTADMESVAYWKEHMSPEQQLWFAKGAEELRVAAKRKPLVHPVKNVIVFMANGVSSAMLAHSRFRGSTNATNFIWDTFPYVGSLRTQCGVSSSVVPSCDLATVATSLFGGVKTSTGLLGLDRRVAPQNCQQSDNDTYQVQSIFQQAQESQLRTGFITTERVTGPLLAPLYAHSADSKWECDAAIPKHMQTNCLDVATQLMLGHSGQAINVIMGGGKQTLVAATLATDSQVDASACDATDKRNLLEDWKYLKLKSKAQFALLETRGDLAKFNGSKTDYVLGIFANRNLQAEQPDHPKFKTMVMKAMQVLNHNSSGYVAVIETAMDGQQLVDFQKSLLELDDVIQATVDDKSFPAASTLVLVAFMNLPKLSSNRIMASEDIRIHATGPNAHLFHRVHDETYLAHAISYSLKIGPFSAGPSRRGFKS